MIGTMFVIDFMNYHFYIQEQYMKLITAIIKPFKLDDVREAISEIGVDDDGRAGIAWGVYGVPETYLMDATGLIQWRHAGPLTRDVIANQLQPLLKKIK